MKSVRFQHDTDSSTTPVKNCHVTLGRLNMNDIDIPKTDPDLLVNMEEIDDENIVEYDDDSDFVSYKIVPMNAPLYKSARVCTTNKETQTEVTGNCHASTDLKLMKLPTSERFVDGVELSPLTCQSMTNIVGLFAAEISKQITTRSQTTKLSFFTQLPQNVYIKRTVITYNDSNPPATKCAFSKMTSDLYYRFDVAIQNDDTNAIKQNIQNSPQKPIVIDFEEFATQSRAKIHTPMEHTGDKILKEEKTELQKNVHTIQNKNEEIKDVCHKNSTLANINDTALTNLFYDRDELKRKFDLKDNYSEKNVVAKQRTDNNGVQHLHDKDVDSKEIIKPINEAVEEIITDTKGIKSYVDKQCWKPSTNCDRDDGLGTVIPPTTAAVQNIQSQPIHSSGSPEVGQNNIGLCKICNIFFPDILLHNTRYHGAKRSLIWNKCHLCPFVGKTENSLIAHVSKHKANSSMPIECKPKNDIDISFPKCSQHKSKLKTEMHGKYIKLIKVPLPLERRYLRKTPIQPLLPLTNNNSQANICDKDNEQLVSAVDVDIIESICLVNEMNNGIAEPPIVHKDIVEPTIDKLSEFLENFGQHKPVENANPETENDKSVENSNLETVEVNSNGVHRNVETIDLDSSVEVCSEQSTTQVNSVETTCSTEKCDTQSRNITNSGKRPIKIAPKKQFDKPVSKKDFLKKMGFVARKSYKCVFCDEVWDTLESLKFHIRRHDFNRNCPVCIIGMKNSDLLKHFKTLHPTLRLSECLHCEFTSCSRKDLRNHRVTTHNITGNDYEYRSTDKKFRIPDQFSDLQMSEAAIRKLFNPLVYRSNKKLTKKKTTPSDKITNTDEVSITQKTGQAEILQDIGEIISGSSDLHDVQSSDILTEMNSSTNIAISSDTPENPMIANDIGQIVNCKDTRDTKWKFQCTSCPAGYNRVKKLNSHCRQKHPKSFKCPFCAETFAHEWFVRNHCIRSHGFVRTCPICGVKLQNKHMKFHSSNVHVGKTLYLCPHCPYICPAGQKKKDIIKHIAEHKDLVNCALCYKRFEDNTDLHAHTAKRHPTYPLVKCNKCMEKFASARLLIKHKKSRHKDTDTIVCSICGLKVRQYGVSTHMHIHRRDNPLMCNICGKIYRSTASFRYHMSKTHAVNPKYTCAECGKVFHHKSLFNDHMNIHLGLKPYGCKLCGTTYTALSLYKKHCKKHHPTIKMW